jgi:hypothetical protein
MAADSRVLALRLALENYVSHVVEMSFAALHAFHGKRGFATIEKGLRSVRQADRAEALETLLNFGPTWLVEPLVQLLDPEAFETAAVRPLSDHELQKLEKHPDAWVQEAAEMLSESVGHSLQDLLALGKLPIFANLDLQQLASIDRLMVTRRLPQGEALFRAGEVNQELCILLDGEVRIHRDIPGRRVTLAKLGPGSFMGEMALFEEQPRSASAEALAACTVRVLHAERLDTIVREHPEVLMAVVRNLSMRLRAADAQLGSASGLESPSGPPGPSAPPLSSR